MKRTIRASLGLGWVTVPDAGSRWLSVMIVLALTFFAAREGASQSRLKPIAVGGALPPPQKIHDVPAAYNGPLSGTVIIEVLLAPDGSIASARALTPHSPLVEPALAAVRQWRYTPVLFNGDPVWAEMNVTVRFPQATRPKADSGSEVRAWVFSIDGVSMSVPAEQVNVREWRLATGRRLEAALAVELLALINFRQFEVASGTHPEVLSTLTVRIRHGDAVVDKQLLLCIDGTARDADDRRVRYGTQPSLVKRLRDMHRHLEITATVPLQE